MYEKFYVYIETIYVPVVILVLRNHFSHFIKPAILFMSEINIDVETQHDIISLQRILTYTLLDVHFTDALLF